METRRFIIAALSMAGFATSALAETTVIRPGPCAAQSTSITESPNSTPRVGSTPVTPASRSQRRQVIVGSSKQLLGQVQTITAAAEEQSASAAQIGDNIQRVTAVSNESAQAAQQASEAAAELSRQSERLRVLVDRFKL